jgi:hypothetical protein
MGTANGRGGAGMGEAVLPLRPLTVGELLDAAINLLRRNAVRLLSVAAGLAVAEQLLLYPLRRLAAVTPPFYFPPYADRLGTYWLLLATGMGTEAVAIAVLGGLAGRYAVGTLGGTPPLRVLPLATVALVTGLGAWLAAAAALLPWILWYLFTGLGGPVVAVDRRTTTGPGPARLVPYGPFPAMGRGMALVSRGGLRPGGVRLLGALAWWPIRLALGAGSIALLSLAVQVQGAGWAYVASGAAWAAANTIAYGVLGCLDAVLHLENRMRVEGLDIAVTRARRRGEPADLALAVPR